MAKPKRIHIQESMAILKALQRKSGHLISNRIRVLIEIKKHEATGISKRALSIITGINHNSILKWQKMYLSGGIDSILKHGRIGFKKSLINSIQHKAIEKKLNDPKNGLRGYIELLTWVNKEFGIELKYNTLVKYAMRHFGSKIKVARKSHIKKDDEAVENFKKTSVESVRKASLKQMKNIKK
jgi:transposase